MHVHGVTVTQMETEDARVYDWRNEHDKRPYRVCLRDHVKTGASWTMKQNPVRTVGELGNETEPDKDSGGVGQ